MSARKSTGVASHLGIALDEYDRRIRTFIPDYETLVDEAGKGVPRRARVIVDLGTGTGALGARCLQSAPRARIVGIDADPAIIELAARRIGPRADFITGSFAATALPRADAVVASLALHHVRTPAAKRRLYKRVRAALAKGGAFVTADAYPASSPSIAGEQLRAWRDHLRRTYSPAETAAYFRAWSHDDVYMTLATELDILRDAGFAPDVTWRRGVFAVIVSA